MERRTVTTGTEWESTVGYARAVEYGDTVHVSGTTATDEGEVIATGDPYGQAHRALENIEAALAETSATIEDVVRTRLYVTDIDDWEEIGRAHGEVFGKIQPATTMVETSRLIHPEMLVEIEAVAIVSSGSVR